jgi:cystathionine beta-synthase
MRDNHLLDPASVRVGNIAAGKSARVRTLHKVDAGEPLKRALALIQQHDVSQLPVFRGGDVVGTLEEGDVLRSALADPASLELPLDAIMGPPLPVVGADEPADVVTKLLASRNSAVLVKNDGAVTGILTRFDMLQFIAGGE